MALDKKTGLPEIEIYELKPDDEVTYIIGVNKKGPCATQVTIVGRKDQAQSESMLATSQKQKLPLTPNDKNRLIETLTDVINVCADADGWALCSSVGTRISLMHLEANQILNAKGYKLAEFLRTNDDIFEYSADGKSTNKYKAACVRLAKK